MLAQFVVYQLSESRKDANEKVGLPGASMGESRAMEKSTLCAMIRRGGNEEKREERKGKEEVLCGWSYQRQTPAATLAEIFDVRAENIQVKYILNKMTGTESGRGRGLICNRKPRKREKDGIESEGSRTKGK